MWYKQKEYYSINKWVGIFNKDYKNLGIKVKANELHQLFAHYGIPKLTLNKNGEVCENGIRAFYPVKLVYQMRTMREDFLYVLRNIVEYGAANGKDYIINKYKQDSNPIKDDYYSHEDEMRKASDELIDKYQFESKKKIYVSEQQILKIFGKLL